MVDTFKTDNWIALGIAVVLLIGCGVSWFIPQTRRLDDLRNEITRQQTQLELNRSEVAVIPALVRRIDALKKEYASFNKTMPQSKELAGFLTEISAILASEQITNQSIEPGDPVREELYHTLPIIMKFEGSYLSLASLLKRIDEMERLTRVQKMAIKTDDNSKSVNIELHMNIYFAEG